MLSSLLAIHFVLTIVIIGLILLQKHDSDGALGSSGGGAASGMFSVRGQANLLTRATAILMTLFIINCLVMAKIAKNSAKHMSVIDVAAQNTEKIKAAEQSQKANKENAAVPAAPASNNAADSKGKPASAPVAPAKPTKSPATPAKGNQK